MEKSDSETSNASVLTGRATGSSLSSEPALDLPIPQKFSQYGLYVKLSHGKTYYELQGPEDAIPFVFVHGLTISSYMYDNFVERLVKRGGIRILTYDLYGHNYTEVPKVPVTIELLVEQLKEILDFVFPTTQKVILFAMSLGGAIGGSFASKYPERIQRLVMACPAGAVDQAPLFNVSALLSESLSLRLSDWVWNLVGKSLAISRLEEKRFTDNFYRHEAVSKDMREDWVKRALWSYRSKEGFLDVLFYVMVNWDLFNLYKSWTNINSSIPVDLIWGDKDPVTQVGNSERIKSVIPHANLHILKNCGHGCIFEEEEQAYKIILGKDI